MQGNKARNGPICQAVDYRDWLKDGVDCEDAILAFLVSIHEECCGATMQRIASLLKKHVQVSKGVSLGECHMVNAFFKDLLKGQVQKEASVFPPGALFAFLCEMPQEWVNHVERLYLIVGYFCCTRGGELTNECFGHVSETSGGLSSCGRSSEGSRGRRRTRRRPRRGRFVREWCCGRTVEGCVIVCSGSRISNSAP